MLRVHPQHIAEGLLPLGYGLAGQTVHQIQGHIAEARLADFLESRHRLGIGMGSSQLFQHIIVVILHTQAHPVEALCPHPVQ